MSLLSYAEVSRLVGLSTRSIRRLIDSGSFPQPLDLGGRVRKFRADEVEAWIDSRPRASVPEPVALQKARARAAS
ncbi:MAG: helix-turn-helix domain-containing protein [Gammaproteobacteria bacterium]|nr:helix-turn-helix domain-containing protein [Gammaproteobacteria bacterium]